MHNVDPYQAFFLEPQLPRHRRYEVLRAWFVERLPAKTIAARFGMSHLSVQSQIRDFKKAFEQGESMKFFVESTPGPA